MIKRNPLHDFLMIRSVYCTKTLKIDVNHGRARRGLLMGIYYGFTKEQQKNAIKIWKHVSTSFSEGLLLERSKTGF